MSCLPPLEPTIRRYRGDESRAIAEIFSSAVHQIASEVYTPQQCRAWADGEVNYEHWRNRCRHKNPWVSVRDGVIAGFLELDPDGHIDCAYVNPRFKRRGVMTGLVDHAVARCVAAGLDRVFVEASIQARPLFIKCGFRVLEEHQAQVNGVALLNYRMERRLCEASNSPPATGRA